MEILCFTEAMVTLVLHGLWDQIAPSITQEILTLAISGLLAKIPM